MGITNSSKLTKKINNGSVFFFAGSGISYASNIPSANMILKNTTKTFFPQSVSANNVEEIVKNIQPEVFYELLISLTDSIHSLDLWQSVMEAKQLEFGNICAASIVHLFIAKYSFKHNKPIFTTNFDTMFENACNHLGIPFYLYLPNDKPPTTQDELAICKLHGTVQDKNEAFSPESLWTTMTAITKVNQPWIDFLSEYMNSDHICIVGYSGKDIDIFPYIKNASENSKEPYWINDFSSDHSDYSSKSINAVRVNLFPNDFLEEASDNLEISLTNLNKIDSRKMTDQENILSALRKELRKLNLLNQAGKHLFFALSVSKIGHYKKAHRLLLHIEEKQFEQLSTNHQILLLLALSRIHHEVSLYKTCGVYAEKALDLIRKSDGGVFRYEVQARCLLSESKRMLIPNDIYQFSPENTNYPIEKLRVLLHFVSTTLLILLKTISKELRNEKEKPDANHEFIEHQIRLIALIQSFAGNPLTGWPILIKEALSWFWKRIRKKSTLIGYPAGIANAQKFEFRLNQDSTSIDESKNIYSLLTSSTGEELLLRNEAELFLKNKNYDQAIQKFSEYIKKARISGNRLNEIKGIIGFAKARKDRGDYPVLTDAEKSRFSELYPKIEGKLWNEYFKSIERTAF